MFRLRLLSAAAMLGVTLGSGCSSDVTSPDEEPAILDAARMFNRLADSLAASGADANVVVAYRGMASTVMNNHRVSPVTISVDGVPTEFLATARQVEVETPPPCPPNALCVGTPQPLRSVIAWQKSDPRRVVQLTSPVNAFTIAIYPPAPVPAAPFMAMPTLTWFDGAGGVYFGTGGPQSIAVTTSDTPCYTPATGYNPPTIAPLATCTRAEFTVSFEGTVQPAPVVLRGSSASGTHTIAMAKQFVQGARMVLSYQSCIYCISVGYPPPLGPPIAIASSTVLGSTLDVAVGSDVKLSFRVTNLSSAPADVRFNSAQQYDFVVRTNAGVVWRWAADKGFATVLTSRVIAPGETVEYVERWTPPAKGAYVATATLTSSSHRADAALGFVVP